MRRERARRPVWQLRTVIPGLLAVVFLLDAGMRFMSIDPFTFRAWEALQRDRPPGAAFEPNRRYFNARSYGNLAAIGNFPALRLYRPARVTTDALGFRNPPHILDEEVSAILIGDSFAVGSEVGDDETLSSQLTKLTGCAVYNASGLDADVVPARILAVARRLHLRPRLVVRLYSEDAQVPPLPTRRMRLTWKLVASTPVRLRDLVGRLRGFIEVSPLQILSGRTLKELEDDRILPNPHAVNVVRATLYNGESMLFLAANVNKFYRKRELSLDYWRWLRDDLRKADFDLLVVLIPGKYRVYRPFLINQRPVGHEASDYLDRLERGLRTMGVSVFNLTAVLSTQAARYLKRGEYLYWRDDMHWNAQGIALAAEAIRQAWPKPEAPCRSPVAQQARSGLEADLARHIMLTRPRTDLDDDR